MVGTQSNRDFNMISARRNASCYHLMLRFLQRYWWNRLQGPSSWMIVTPGTWVTSLRCKWIKTLDFQFVKDSSVWWFGTFFFHILGIIFPTDFHIFKRGSSHQPVFGFVIFKPLPLPLETSSYPKGWWHSISSSRKNLACNNSWVHTTYNMIYQVPEKNIQLLTRYTLGC
jgi:hypothetical protein